MQKIKDINQCHYNKNGFAKVSFDLTMKTKVCLNFEKHPRDEKNM